MRVLVNNQTNIITGECTYDVDQATLDLIGCRFYDIPDNLYSTSMIGRQLAPAGGLVPLDTSWQEVRDLRDGHLELTDWTQLQDAPLTAEKVLEFATWRQQLRDIPGGYQTPAEAMSALQALIEAKPTK